MNKLEELIDSINRQDVGVLGTGVGEQGYIISKLKRPIFFLASSMDNAYKISEQLTSLGCKNVLLDSFDEKFVLSKFQSRDNTIKLINSLIELKNGTEIIVTTMQGLLFPLTNPENFYDSILSFESGKNYDLDMTVASLVEMGYTRCDSIEQVGDFALRGDILDLFAPNHEYPIRINFFDDEIERIIYFDNVNLVSIKQLEKVFVAPNKLLMFDENEKTALKNMENVLDKEANGLNLNYLSNLNLTGEYLSFYGIEEFYLDDYLKNSIIVMQYPLTLMATLEKEVKENTEKINQKFKDENIKKILINKLKNNFEKILKKRKIILENSENNLFCEKYIDFNSKKLNNYLNNLNLINLDFNENELKNKTIKLCLSSENTLNSIKDIMFHKSIPYSLKEDGKGFVLTTENIPYNICLKDEDVWFVGSTNFAHKKELISVATKKIKYLPKAGEYVVHDIHGIGLCEGVVTLKVMGVEKDFFKILYQKGDVLYLPTENTDRLSLYLGASDVKLNKLGGKEFSQVKERTEKAIEDMAKDLLKLYAVRSKVKGYRYSPDNYLMTEFENSFEHVETVDQMQAIIDVKRDMMSDKVMDRLICGDVGYGKTEVAVRASFKAFLDGKQTAVLAPTTILSLQHFMTFSKRFKNFGVRVEMLNRFKTQKEKDEILKKLKSGEIDVICGTHSLLSDNVEFSDLGLLILDEEQRFGVKAKEKLKVIKNNVDVITMSATPIPRTLNMALLTLRDISIINTPPVDRLPIKTYVQPFDMEMCVNAVNKELNRGGQVLIVYNDIEKMFSFGANLIKALNNPKCKMDVAHGKMQKSELENAIKRLYDGQTNVFLSTTLIENGVDLPKANTLIVLDSQNLGLSQLYQLRGRVGRSNEQAYAYFTYPSGKTITIEATDRLEALAENTELGSGFKIAMRDLQLRGAGELLGKTQHGHMVKVGYDMYIKLLEEATKRLNGEEIVVNRDVKIDIALNAKIPSDFILDENEKLKIYSKLTNIDSVASQKEIIQQLKSSYGKLPKEVLQLTNVALIKALAEKAKLKRIIISKTNYSLEYYKDTFDVEKILKLLTKFNKFSLQKGDLPTIKLNVHEFSPETAQGYIIEFLTSQFDEK